MSLFKKPNELSIKKTIKMLVYGQPGLGKSTIALSAPKPCLIDTDGGVQRVNGAFQCPTLQVSSWEQINEALNEDLSEFDTIVIDTAGKMLDFMATYIIKNDSKMASRDGGLTLKGYGARKQMFINFIKRCETLGKHIVFVAHEREDKDGDTRIVRPEIGGSSAGDLIKELDLVGYMQAIGTDRTIYWNPQEKFYAKNTCNLPQSYKVPTIIDVNGVATGQNNFLSIIFKNYEKYLGDQKKYQEKYTTLLEQITEDVKMITDCESANAIREKVLGYEHLWDSKVRAERIIYTQCQLIGVKYNKAKDTYEPAA